MQETVAALRQYRGRHMGFTSTHRSPFSPGCWSFAGRLATCLGVALLYFLLFAPAYAVLFRAAVALSLAPILTAAILFGTRGGLTAGLLAMPLNLFLLLQAEGPSLAPFLGRNFFISHGVFLFVGGMVGRLCSLKARLQEELLGKETAQKKLSQREQLLNSILESMRDGILVLDREYRFTYWNRAMEEMTRVPREQLLGTEQQPWDIFPHLSQQGTDELMREAMQGRAVGRDEIPYHLPDGSQGFTSENFFPLCSGGREIEGIIGIVRDVTASKQVEEELRKHRDRLEDMITARTVELEMVNNQLQQEIVEREQIEEEIRRLNDGLEKIVRDRTEELKTAFDELQEIDNLKDSFLSVVSHELRTPLTSIRSFSEILLLYENEDRATQREFLEIINAESQRLTRLINNVLDISKIEAKKMVYLDESISLEEVIRDVTRAQHRQLEEKSMALRLEVPPELPCIFADRDRIHQVITNLLSNAVKFSHGGGEILIRACTFREGETGGHAEWIRVSVQDQGIGIEEKDTEIIFEKFQQVASDTLKDRPKGTGLGLPICREIISHYQGRISVKSRKGEGCTFFFTLPADAGSSSGKSSNESPGLPRMIPEKESALSH
jgi:PAS domain S-box-containing protein